MNEGFSWLRLDKNGYNNQFEVKKQEIDYLFMGSSHTEAFNVAGDKSVAYLLNKYLAKDYTYNISMSGHFFLSCVKNLENAYKKYKPKKAIIIETFNISFSQKDIKNILEKKYPIINLHTENKIVYYLQKYLPSIRTLFLQTKSWFNVSTKFFKKVENTSETIEKKDNDLSVLMSFTRKSIPDNVDIIVFYHPYTEIDCKGNLPKYNLNNIFDFRKACLENNIKFIDTTPDFIELYKTRHILGHGFINTKVGVGHLNRYGHEVIAKRLVKEINKLNEVTQ